MRKLVPLVLLAATLSGCIGSVTAARIPSSTLDDQGWSRTDTSSRSMAFGLAELKVRDYRSDGGFAGATVASMNNAPIVNEEKRVLPLAIKRIEKSRDVNLVKTGTRQMDLVNLDTTVTADVYRVENAPGDAKAVIFTPPCDPFVIVVGYGSTGGGIVAGASYEDARNVVRHVICG